MRLKDKQERQFYRVLNALADYTNETRGILGYPFDPFSPGKSFDHLTYGREMDALLESLWDDKSIIDQFLVENPMGMSRADLNAAADFRYALKSSFTLVGYESGYSHFMVDDMIYEVISVGMEITDIIPEDDLPRSVTAALLPFDGGIVFDMTLSDVPFVFTPDMLVAIENEYEAIKARGNIFKSAQALIRNAEHHAQAKRNRENDRKLDEYQREQRRQRGTDAGADLDVAMPSGMHRGALAGVAYSEREAAIAKIHAENAAYKRKNKKQLDQMVAKFPKSKPQTTLKGALGITSEDRLDELADLALVWVHYSASKERLISGLLRDRSWVKEILSSVLVIGNRREYEFFMRMIENDGYLVQEISEIKADELYPFSPPFITHYRSGNQLITVMPKEFVETYHKMDLEEIAAKRIIRQHLIDCMYVAADIYGMVSITEFVDLYQHYYPEDRRTVVDLFGELISIRNVGGTAFGLWADSEVLDDDDYHDDLNFDFDEALNDEYDDYDLYSSGKRLRLASVTDKVYMLRLELLTTEELWQSGFEPDPGFRDEIDDRFVVEFRRHLIERHRMIPRRMLKKEELENFHILTYCRRHPEVEQLISYLDTRVPDGYDDTLFANEMFSQLHPDMQFDLNMETFLATLAEAGYVFGSTDTLEDFMTVLMNAANTMPRWENNGYSANQMQELGIKPLS